MDAYFDYAASREKISQIHPELKTIEYDKINTLYQPEVFKTDAKVTLFKATQSLSQNHSSENIANIDNSLQCVKDYYCKTMDNHINEAIYAKKVEVIEMNADHDYWVRSSETVDKVAHRLKKCCM